MKSLAFALASVLLLPLPCDAGEPSAVLDVSAKTIGRHDLASTTRVRIELSLNSKIDLPAVAVRGARVGSHGFKEEFGIADRILTLPRNAGRKLVYELELERGSVHHLIFYVESQARSGAASAGRSSAYLRINLDPTLEPEDLGNVLQYRAKMANGDGR